MTAQISKATIWCDGSTYPKNPGYGGWGAVIHIDEAQSKKVIAINGILPSGTTNNVSETMALFEAISFLTSPYKLIVFTDSVYVKRYIEILYEGGHIKSNNTLWKNVKKVLDLHKGICVVRIKGHSGNKHHNMADRMAYWASKYRYELYEETVLTNTNGYKKEFIPP